MSIKEEFRLYSFENTKDSICAEVLMSSEQLFYISCRFCDNTFKNYEKFINHFYKNHIDNNIKETTFSYEEKILYTNDYIDKTTYKPEISKKLVNNNNTTILVSSNSDANVDNTQKTYTSLRAENCYYKKVENVIKLKNIDDNRKFQCNLCPTKFWTFDQLSLHHIIHNFKQIKPNLKSSIKQHKIKFGKFQQPADKNPNRFYCSECLSSFWSMKQFELHKTSHNNNVIDNNNSKLKHRNISFDELMIEEPIEEFYNKILEKNKANKQQCDTCGMCFSSVTSLKRHIMKHTGERPYKCEHCSRGFIRRQALLLHLGAHSGEKQYKCEQCDKAYYRKDALQHHMKIHSGNVFFCSYCDKKFKINSEKIYHERRHNSINRKRPFRSRKEKKLTITSTTPTKIETERVDVKDELMCCLVDNLEKNTFEIPKDFI